MSRFNRDLEVSASITVERPVPVTREDVDNYVELDVDLTGSATPFVRGRSSGPPERCYPDEGGEIEILTVLCNGVKFELTDAEEGKAQEALREAANEAARDAAEAWADARAEDRDF